MSASSAASRRPRARSRKQPIEYSLLMTATLCLIAFGAVMVFSASSATSLLGTSGDSLHFLKRTLIFGAAGLIVMRFLSLRGVRVVRSITPLLLVASFALLVAVLIPGVGTEVNGARRWVGAGFLQFQPSELAKLSLILYGVKLLAERPALVADVGSLMRPYLLVVSAACLLIVIEPDLGTAMVVAFAVTALLIAAGARFRDLALIAAVLGVLALLAIMVEPYRRERLTSFLNPGADATGAGFQGIQAMIAMGSGGLFGVGLGESVQKIFYLPEAHTDMILAVIGEELGLMGVTVLVGLFIMLAYAGLRTAKRARDRYSKLLAAGLTSLILVQAVLNFAAVMGLAPLTGVPLPFVSYGNSNLLVMMAAVGLLLNVARGGTAKAAGAKPRATSRAKSTGGRGAKLRVIEGQANRSKERSTGANSRDSRGGDRRSRRSGHSGRRRATG